MRLVVVRQLIVEEDGLLQVEWDGEVYLAHAAIGGRGAGDPGPLRHGPGDPVARRLAVVDLVPVPICRHGHGRRASTVAVRVLKGELVDFLAVNIEDSADGGEENGCEEETEDGELGRKDRLPPGQTLLAQARVCGRRSDVCVWGGAPRGGGDAPRGGFSRKVFFLLPARSASWVEPASLATWARRLKMPMAERRADERVAAGRERMPATDGSPDA